MLVIIWWFFYCGKFLSSVFKYIDNFNVFLDLVILGYNFFKDGVSGCFDY